MGVKDLWTILTPVRQEISLADLAGKTIAVDLSCWVCQADTTKGLADSVQKPYLRNLFFRIHRLYCEGVSLVMVVDGEATQLKWSTMNQREKAFPSRGGGGACNRRTGKRYQLDSKTRECLELLDALGVPHLQSEGEAEALCALLNSQGLVDGVLTQDSDTFLYGAKVVYKDLSTVKKDSQVDSYSLRDIESQLGLNRRDMVSLALLLGCDYSPQGVHGVGKEGAMKLIGTCKSCDRSCDMLDVIKGWRDGTRSEDSMSRIEAQVRRKALAVAGFPSEAIINEYLVSKDKLPKNTHNVLTWRFPRGISLQVVCHRLLEWPFEYTHNKLLPLMVRWVLRNGGVAEGEGRQGQLTPLMVTHLRKRQGVEYYEVVWNANGKLATILTDDTVSLASSPSLPTDDQHVQFTTLEKIQLFSSVFPNLCTEFEEQKKLTKKKGKKASKKKNPSTSEAHSSDELTAALDDLRLLSPKKDLAKLKALRTEAASVLCGDAHPCGIERVSKRNEESLRGGGGPENSNVDEVAPLCERLKAKTSKCNATMIETEKRREDKSTGHTVCDEVPTLCERLKTRTKDTTDTGTKLKPATVKVKSTANDFDKCCIPHKEAHYDGENTSRQIEVSTTVEDTVKQIVIDDSSSDDELEDPLASVKAVGKSQRMTSSLHQTSSTERMMSSLHHNSSGDESTSDDDLPPLANMIGSKRPGATSSPIQTKVSPAKDLILSSKNSTTTSRRRNLARELSDIKCRGCDGEVENNPATSDNPVASGESAINRVSGSTSGEVIIVGCSRVPGKPSTNKQSVSNSLSCIGSAESPIEID